MGDTYERHRPLMAGIKIHSHVPGSGQFLPGTLTGAAIRNCGGTKGSVPPNGRE